MICDIWLTKINLMCGIELDNIVNKMNVALQADTKDCCCNGNFFKNCKLLSKWSLFQYIWSFPRACNIFDFSRSFPVNYYCDYGYFKTMISF